MQQNPAAQRRGQPRQAASGGTGTRVGHAANLGRAGATTPVFHSWRGDGPRCTGQEEEVAEVAVAVEDDDEELLVELPESDDEEDDAAVDFALDFEERLSVA